MADRSDVRAADDAPEPSSSSLMLRPASSTALPRPSPSAPAGGELDVEEHVDLTRYLAALRRHWKVLALFVLLAASLAILRFAFTQKEYRATTVIQIERKKLSVVATGGQSSWLEDWWNMEYYPTQYRLLRSRGMAERVVLNLGLHEEAALRDASLLPSDDAAAGTGDLTGIDDGALARFASGLKARLTVNPIEDTQLVELSYRSNDPDEAARIANGYAEAFIQWGIETRVTTVGEASAFLTDQIAALRNDIERQQKQLRSYNQATDYALDPAGEALIERQRVLEEQYNQVIADRIRKEAAFIELREMPDTTLASTLGGERATRLAAELRQLRATYQADLDLYTPEWPAMQALQRRIDAKQGELTTLSRTLAKEARDQAQAAYQQAQREEQTLASALRALRDEATGMNSTALEYANLQTQLQQRRSLLNEMLKRQSETEVASRIQRSQGSNVRIVDRAIAPAHPFRPVLGNDLVKFLFLGFALGVGLVVLLEFNDRTVKTAEEIEALLGLPTLAVIPDIADPVRGTYGRRRRKAQRYGYGYGGDRIDSARLKRPSTARRARPEIDERASDIELLPHRHPRLAVCEAYRGLRAALLLSTANTLQIVALTSAEPGEGKTATSTNLAIVLSQLGRRVLIIDCDLRRPRMHKVFGLSNRIGLVSHLTGPVEPQDLYNKTEVPNLYVCTSGPIPPNPSELLASDRMRAFVEAQREHFDFIVVDTPPTLPVADAVIIGQLVDGVVLCARAGVLEREDAVNCRERLRYAEAKLLGLVFNRYRPQASRYYHRRYRYYDAHYGDDDATEEDAA
ncbi:MAG: polysaccharide biosynthesis tyrosine autokinase [Acidobacteriota bacterium]